MQCNSRKPNGYHSAMNCPMKFSLLFFFCGALVAQNRPVGERHEFVIANFHTESGAVLCLARELFYGTYGHLNADKSNAVLLPSHYMANFHGYEWLIGEGKALDPADLFLVATELFGNGSVPLRRAIRPGNHSTVRVFR